MASLDLPPFRPRFPWWGADLQTIAIRLGPFESNLSPHISERICFCMADRSGDILVGMLDRPAEPQANRPLVILVHGITGCENSSHVLNGARHLLALGYRVLRLNLRGCGASRPHCREHYHIGRTADFRRILSQLPDDLTDNGIAVVGYSMGGAMLLKYLGEEGSFSPLRAAATICAPLDLAAGGNALGRGFNRVYTRMFLATLKKKALAKALRFPGVARADVIAAARDLYDFDNEFTAPVHGFRGTEDYWARASAKPWLRSVKVPHLVLNALNDPFVPAASLPGAADVSKFVRLEQPRDGGHVGFASGRVPGELTFLPERVFAFFAAPG